MKDILCSILLAAAGLYFVLWFIDLVAAGY